MEEKTFVHLNPIWHDKANYIIGARCFPNKDSDTQGWEQLWSRQLTSNRFEICCIPFFVYDLALGDEVEIDSDYMIRRVTRWSGHYTFRVWFGDSPESSIRDEVIAEVTCLGGLMEWYSQKLLGIDAASASQAQDIADFLFQKQQVGHLIYETGKTQ